MSLIFTNKSILYWQNSFLIYSLAYCKLFRTVNGFSCLGNSFVEYFACCKSTVSIRLLTPDVILAWRGKHLFCKMLEVGSPQFLPLLPTHIHSAVSSHYSLPSYCLSYTEKLSLSVQHFWDFLMQIEFSLHTSTIKVSHCFTE